MFIKRNSRLELKPVSTWILQDADGRNKMILFRDSRLSAAVRVVIFCLVLLSVKWPSAISGL